MAHAKLSPSAAHRWIPCPGSVFLSEGIPDTSSQFADEGSAAHFLASTCLIERVDAKEYLNKTIAVHSEGEAWVKGDEALPRGYNLFHVNHEMVENVQVYLDLVRGEAGDLYVEQKYGIGHITGEADAKGTADAVIINGTKLTIIDLKYGRGVKVDAQSNLQLGLYAAGAIEHWAFCEEFDEIELIICQPRIDHIDRWTTGQGWIQEICKLASESAGKALSQTSKSGFYWPGEKQCGFCKAKGKCAALTEKVLATITDEFVDLDAPIAPQLEAATADLLTNDQIGNLLASIDFIESWCKGIRAQAEAELFAGRDVPGFKLVGGRRGARAWGDAAEVESEMKKMRIKQDVMYDLKLISPTSAEKAFKDGTIGPRQWPKLQSMITQAQGKPSVAPASDKRPALVLQAAEDEFENLAQPEAFEDLA